MDPSSSTRDVVVNAADAQLGSTAAAPAERCDTATATLARPVLTARDVSLGFGAKTVLSEVDLDFPPGAVTALIGPTGCGKSTFLRTFNRLNDKVRGFWRRGSVELEGLDIYGGSADPLLIRRRVGMVFQRPNPFPMSISDNVVAGVKAHRLATARGASRNRRRASEAGRPLVGDRGPDGRIALPVVGRSAAASLSRAGARRRTRGAACWTSRPLRSTRCPTEMVEDLIRKLAPELTIVIVTHNLAQARRIVRNNRLLVQRPARRVGRDRPCVRGS